MGEVANASEDKPDIKVGYQWSLAFSELNSKLYANLRNIAGIGQSRNSTKTGLVKFSRVFAREFVTRIDTLTACKRPESNAMGGEAQLHAPAFSAPPTLALFTFLGNRMTHWVPALQRGH